MSVTTAVADLLTAAHAELAACGLHQGGHLHEATGAVDIAGALRLAADCPPNELPGSAYILGVLLAAEDALALHLGIDPTAADAGEAVAAWCDQPGRTLAQALDLLAVTAGVIMPGRAA
ncbi:DUF6197 family protein [Protofrankia symbiont of Coriaria ruscifolia]|uniref:DUF6197 family protein n=1 Tax=Protofrankia symbiont of Coriaria ruscifolia TaxID=1306542 RepID=UPI0010412B17|nr:hypothetical protein [Protofrankia symbiont of Coriaria ruscifolia]